MRFNIHSFLFTFLKELNFFLKGSLKRKKKLYNVINIHHVKFIITWFSIATSLEGCLRRPVPECRGGSRLYAMDARLGTTSLVTIFAAVYL